MTRVIICGSRSEKEIDFLVEAGVDAIGLITEVRQNFPANLAREQARDLARRVPPFVNSILIITEEDEEKICELVDFVRPDLLQLHGFNRQEQIFRLKEKLKIKIIKTLHLEGNRLLEGSDPERVIQSFLQAGASAILIDRVHEGKLGSTGLKVDLGLAARLCQLCRPVPFILAGGLNPNNVAEVIRKVKPFAVDVFSGVTSHGCLQPEKVKNFLKAVKRTQIQNLKNQNTRTQDRGYRNKGA